MPRATSYVISNYYLEHQMKPNYEILQKIRPIIVVHGKIKSVNE